MQLFYVVEWMISPRIIKKLKINAYAGKAGHLISVNNLFEIHWDKIDHMLNSFKKYRDGLHASSELIDI